MQVAVVTGGASGIGRALGEALVARGDVVVLADIDEAVHTVAQDVTRAGPGTAVPAVVDVRDAPAVAAMVQGAHREHGRLDLLFNNAGVGTGGEWKS
jgi:NAD(P)-dependent dehydrogenase (short-subunit alcohol dehydrogenase family)